jgi:hypothetical protein
MNGTVHSDRDLGGLCQNSNGCVEGQTETKRCTVCMSRTVNSDSELVGLCHNSNDCEQGQKETKCCAVCMNGTRNVSNDGGADYRNNNNKKIAGSGGSSRSRQNIGNNKNFVSSSSGSGVGISKQPSVLKNRNLVDVSSSQRKCQSLPLNMEDPDVRPDDIVLCEAEGPFSLPPVLTPLPNTPTPTPSVDRPHFAYFFSSTMSTGIGGMPAGGGAFGGDLPVGGANGGRQSLGVEVCRQPGCSAQKMCLWHRYVDFLFVCCFLLLQTPTNMCWGCIVILA